MFQFFQEVNIFEMSFKLPELPYDKSAFGKIISVQTFDYHYSKHHQTYVNNLNALIKGTTWENRSLDDIVVNCKDEKIFNNAAQHWNHTFYWYCITPNQTSPSPQLQAKIEAKWGSVANFLTEFSAQAVANFGSGWTWLAKNQAGELMIFSTSNAGNPLTSNFKPLLTVDVWEHAYYIDYRNVRATYVNNFTSIINWNFVNDNFKSEQITLKL